MIRKAGDARTLRRDSRHARPEQMLDAAIALVTRPEKFA